MMETGGGGVMERMVVGWSMEMGEGRLMERGGSLILRKEGSG